jgi:hypothetical protein
MELDPFYCIFCTGRMKASNAPPPSTTRLPQMLMIQCPHCRAQVAVPKSTDPVRSHCRTCTADFVYLPDGTIELIQAPKPPEKPDATTRPRRPTVELAKSIVDKMKEEHKKKMDTQRMKQDPPKGS